MEGDAGRSKGVIASMNVVPLIDILLVLLIIFMVISPVETVGLSTEVPQPSPYMDTVPPGSPLVVQVLSSGLEINQQPVAWQDLGERLESIFALRVEKVAFVRGGDAVEFAEVARAIDVMRGSGVEKVGLLTARVP